MYCWVFECYDNCTYESTCTVEAATDDGAGVITCDEFWEVVDYDGWDQSEDPDQCYACQVNDCMDMYEMFTSCKEYHCVDRCNYDEEHCFVDLKVDNGVEEHFDTCDEFYLALDNHTAAFDEAGCENMCYETEDCTETWDNYDFCSRSTCYDSCSQDTFCIVDWTDHNSFSGTTDC